MSVRADIWVVFSVKLDCVMAGWDQNLSHCVNFPPGQGFAFKRKQKVQYEYKKLLRKEKRKNPESQTLYKDEYPEHLRHLYVAEAEKLKKEAWLNRVNRSKVRMRGHEEEEEEQTEEPAEDRAADEAADPAEDSGGAEQAGNLEGTAAKEAERYENILDTQSLNTSHHSVHVQPPVVTREQICEDLEGTLI